MIECYTCTVFVPFLVHTVFSVHFEATVVLCAVTLNATVPLVHAPFRVLAVLHVFVLTCLQSRSCQIHESSYTSINFNTPRLPPIKHIFIVLSPDFCTSLCEVMDYQRRKEERE